MKFFNSLNKNKIDEAIQLYKRCNYGSHAHVREVTDLIVEMANAINPIPGSKRTWGVYDEYYDFVKLFTCNKKDMLSDLWINSLDTRSEQEVLSQIYEELFSFIGFENGDDVEKEYDNEVIWKVYKAFPELFIDAIRLKRLDYYLANIRNFDPSFDGKPNTYWCDIHSLKKNASYFRISHDFIKDEKDGRLICDSEISFCCPENMELTMRSVSVFLTCSVKQSYRFGYTDEENLELDKWICRKMSFLRFLEIVDQYSEDRSWFLNDDYINEYWLGIYADHKRNKIRLG